MVNLSAGADQVAKFKGDQKSYGDLYQWGRAHDQHEQRTSGTSSKQFTSLRNTGVNNGPFIIGNSDWTSECLDHSYALCYEHQHHYY
jgi:hypothetical protein